MQIDTNALTKAFQVISILLFFFLSAVVVISNDFDISLFSKRDKHYAPNKDFVCRKIAAVLTTFNDEYTIEESISSIAPYVGEVAIIEHGSTDSTPKILQKLANKFPNIIIKAVSSSLPYSEAVNLAPMLSTTPWILPWAGDYFFYPSSAEKMCSLIDYCDQNNLRIINFSIPRIDGDINHVYASKSNGEVVEQRLFRRGAVMSRQKKDITNEKIIPLTRQHSTKTDQFFQIHVASFKNAERLYYHNISKEYLTYVYFEAKKVKKPMEFWDWEYCRLHNTNTTQDVDMKAFKKHRIEKFCKGLVLPYSEFNSKKWGPIPDYLKKLPFFKKFGLKFVKTDENGNKLYHPLVPGCPAA